MIQTSPLPRVLSTNLAHPVPYQTRTQKITGINKVAQPFIEVFTPGPHYGDGSGVAGDTIGDTKHHGGQHKAVYAYAREELDYWGEQLSQNFPDGYFGENLTTEGITWAEVRINQRIKVGTAVLEVSVPRSPCRTFATWLNQRGWVKTFTARGDAGAYMRVITAGTVSPGDTVEFLDAPAHGVTLGTAFAAAMGDKQAARAVAEANCYPPFYQSKVEKLAGITS